LESGFVGISTIQCKLSQDFQSWSKPPYSERDMEGRQFLCLHLWKKNYSMLNTRCFSWLELSVSGSPNYIGNQTNCWSCVNMVWWCLFLLAYYNSENNGYGLVITTISWFPSILTSFSLVFRLWNIRLQSLLFFFQHLNITSSLRNGQTFIAHCGFSQVSIIHSIHITGI
jgi:hypothetical protein